MDRRRGGKGKEKWRTGDTLFVDAAENVEGVVWEEALVIQSGGEHLYDTFGAGIR